LQIEEKDSEKQSDKNSTNRTSLENEEIQEMHLKDELTIKLNKEKELQDKMEKERKKRKPINKLSSMTLE